MKKLAIILTVCSLATPVFATPVASFQMDTTYTTAKTSTVMTSTPANTTGITMTSQNTVSSLPLDVQQELAIMKGLWQKICSEKGLDTYLISPDLTIPASEYETLYQERMKAHANGSKPLPIRYLPHDYDNHYTVADATGSDNTVMYEVVLGYPIFYKIIRYDRPSNHNQLEELPTKNEDKLNTGSLGISGKLGTLYIND